MKGRSVREFAYQADLWPIIDAWAAETGFVPLEKEPTRRLYRKRNLFLMAPAFLEIRYEKGKVTLGAWVKADFFLILNLLSGDKPEARVESGGLTAAVPRRRARQAVNLLLERLGQKPIV
jgi:hypothetical protein